MSETMSQYGASVGASAGASSGRAYGRQRLALGLSLNAVALAARMHPYTLARIERSDESLDETRRARLDAALGQFAARRAHALARDGWTWRDLPRDLRHALARYTQGE